MATPAQRLRDTIAKTTAIGAAVTSEAAKLKTAASQAAQPTPVETEAQNGRADSPGA
jgi:hypothetical protein